MVAVGSVRGYELWGWGGVVLGGGGGGMVGCEGGG